MTTTTTTTLQDASDADVLRELFNRVNNGEWWSHNEAELYPVWYESHPTLQQVFVKGFLRFLEGLETGRGYTDARNEATHRFVEYLRELRKTSPITHFPHI
tara:strand:+ start:19 stop:321 length:303 start_codon:yes stop_codon:yes gene_type:complete